ncbi:MAG: protease inhibitor I42 family protein [Dehalococcoidia bacterium]|nr:protease inhibitor I42 family protein [Dehalococcoidia bacterium]
MRIASVLLALSLLLVVCACAAPQAARPTVNHFYANPASISEGDSCTLNWRVADADTVTIDHALGTMPAVGSCTVTPDETTVYELTATNRSGATVADTTVTVSTKPPAVDMPVINHFESTPNSVMPGGIATLAWDVAGASSVSIGQGVGDVEAQGRKGVIPSGTTKYTLMAVNASGEVSASTNVVVTELATSQPPAEVVSPHIGLQVGTDRQFTINLDASPSTGFQWELDYYDPSFVDLVGSEYEPYSVPQMGSTGSRHFTFNALKVGDTKIKLSYTHPGEPLNSSSKYYHVHITP